MRRWAARIAMPAVLDDRNVDIDDVALLQSLVAGNAVTDDMIDRGADGFRKAAVVERCGNRLLHIDDVVVAAIVQFVGRHAGHDVGRDHIQHIRRETAGHSHLLLLGRGFDRHLHVSCLSNEGWCRGARARWIKIERGIGRRLHGWRERLAESRKGQAKTFGRSLSLWYKARVFLATKSLTPTDTFDGVLDTRRA
jgi:hypothetical protein